jgi:hypothetical protein
MPINRKYGNKPKSGASISFVQDSPLMKSEFYQGPMRKYNKRTLATINHLSKKMTKTAAGGCNVGGDSRTSSPMFYHPEYEPSSLLMPRDPIEINAWARYFYKYDALVSTAIDCHAELPISTIRFTMPKGSDRKRNVAIKEEYEEMCSTEYLDLFNKLLQIGVEYYKLGNVFPFAQWSEEKKKWIKLTLLDPDYVEIDKLQFSSKMRIDLRPNDRLKEIVHNGPHHPKTGLLYQAVPEDVRDLIVTGKKIPLNTSPNNGSHVSHIAYKMADYDTLGTGLIERNFKPLVYKDRLRQSQDAIAARHLTPKHLLWADYAGNADVEAIREQVDNAFADPDYAIITNYELHWELIGTSTGLMQLDSEWSWINEELMIGLMINKSFLLGEGSFANGQTVLEVMNQRYAIYRERLENYVIHSLFLPMAKRNDWAEYVPGTLKKEKKVRWLYPSIKWNKLNFVDDTSHKQMLSQMVSQGQIDLETWLECFGLDAETIADRLKKWSGTNLDVSQFEINRSMASEVGRILAPAVAKRKAEEEGLQLEDPNAGNAMFANKDKMKKEATVEEEIAFELGDKEIEKEAETRDQREHERTVKQNIHRTDKIVKELEVPTEKRKKPPRKDLKVPKLFEASEKGGYDEVPFLDPHKSTLIAAEVKTSESEKDKWISSMIELGFDTNSRRAALNLENDLLSLNGNNDSKNRISILKKYLPQIYASKIKEGSIFEKTESAKSKFENQISSACFNLESKLSRSSEPKNIKRSVRLVLQEVLK